jgi:hypothetical protein
MLKSDFKEVEEIELTEPTYEFCRDKIIEKAEDKK